MLPLVLGSLAAVVVVNLLVSTLVLRLMCRLFRVRGVHAAGVTFRRALGLVLLIAVAGWVFGIPLAVWSSKATTVELALAALAAQVVLAVLTPLVILRLGLPAGWGRALGVGLCWQVIGVGQAVLTVLFFRAYVCEAFTVPTGAMAESVLGYHKDVSCPNCGLEFSVNASLEALSLPGQVPFRVSDCTCPNCRQDIHLRSPATPEAKGANLDPDGERHLLNGLRLALNAIPDPGVTSGDRILAGKGFFGHQFLKPSRFDIVLFDFPGERGQPAPNPPIKYIKRLIGLPGESVAIHKGKLFGLAPDRTPADDEARRLFESGEYKPLRKAPAQVLALRRLVYDADHPGKGTANRWRGEGFEAGSGNFTSAGGDRQATLTYRHTPGGGEGKPELVTDFSGYDARPRRQGARTDRTGRPTFSSNANWRRPALRARSRSNCREARTAFRRPSTFPPKPARCTDCPRAGRTASWVLSPSPCRRVVAPL